MWRGSRAATDAASTLAGPRAAVRPNSRGHHRGSTNGR
jgi:hypothetical protein